MTLKWHGDEAIRRINATMVQRLKGAAMYVRGEARKNISRGQPTRLTHGMQRHDEMGRFTKRGASRRVGLDPSAPGEFPKKVTGQLRRRVVWEVDEHKLTARVGTNLPYGKWLEVGTRLMKARPWLLRTVLERASFVKAKFGIRRTV